MKNPKLTEVTRARLDMMEPIAARILRGSEGYPDWYTLSKDDLANYPNIARLGCVLRDAYKRIRQLQAGTSTTA